MRYRQSVEFLQVEIIEMKMYRSFSKIQIMSSSTAVIDLAILAATIVAIMLVIPFSVPSDELLLAGEQKCTTGW